MTAATDFFTSIASAIRSKKGTADPIPAINFPTEIESITTGAAKPSVGIVATEWDVNGYPTKYETYGIATIAENYFRYSVNYVNRYVQEVVFDDTPTSIGSNAFYGCTALTSINIPSNVTTLGIYAFYGCTGLTAITIPKSVVSVGNTLNPPFNNCSNLSTVTLEPGMTKIADGLLRACTAIVTITIPDSVTEIGSFAFYGCTGLTTITIPGNVTQLGGYAFYGCTGLTTITIPKSVVSVGNPLNPPFNNCSNLNTVVFEEGTTTIVYGLVKGLTAMTNVIIPDTVTQFGNYAFADCTGLTSIVLPGGIAGGWSTLNPPFNNCSNLASVTVGKVGLPIIAIGETAFNNCPSITSLTVYTTDGAPLAGAPWGATNATVTYLSA